MRLYDIFEASKKKFKNVYIILKPIGPSLRLKLKIKKNSIWCFVLSINISLITSSITTNSII